MNNFEFQKTLIDKKPTFTNNNSSNKYFSNTNIKINSNKSKKIITKPVLKETFTQMFPTKTIPKLNIKFSARFKSFNGNVSIRKEFNKITQLNFSLSKLFLKSEEEIIKGLIQVLLNKVYKTNIKTLNQDLYNGFIKNLPRYAQRTRSDNFLIPFFKKINKEYFNDLMEQPNIVFGRDSTTVLGHYNYYTDTITISTILKNETDLLEYVMYHEMLHKKHGFKTTGKQTRYHTKEFRQDEKLFRVKDIEKKLERFVAKKKIKKLLFKW